MEGDKMVVVKVEREQMEEDQMEEDQMERDQIEDDKEAQVFGNPLISSAIFSLLDLQNFLKCRAVSQFWAEQVKSELPKRVQVHFSLTHPTEADTRKKVKFCAKHGITNIALTDKFTEKVISADIVAVVEGILAEIYPQIKSIKLNMAPKNPGLIPIIRGICQTCPDLAELIFNVPSSKNTSNEDVRKMTFDPPDFRPRSVVKLLTKIEIAEGLGEEEIKKSFPEEYQEELLKILLTTFPQNLRYAQSLPSVFDNPQPGPSRN